MLHPALLTSFDSRRARVPAIFIGVALATLAIIILGVSPTLAVAVGTAAGMAAMTRLVFASLLLAALLVGREGLDAIPAAVLAAAAAWLVVTTVERRSNNDNLPRTTTRELEA